MNRRDFILGTAGLFAVRPRLKADEPPSRITTGLPSLDELTGGFGAGEVVQIGGRFGTGRSGLGLQIASHVSASSPVVYFSPFVDSIGEFKTDTKRSCLHRMTYAMAGVDLGRFQCGRLTEDDRAKCSRAAAKLAERPLYIYGTREIRDCDLEKLGAAARRLAQTVSPRLIIIDDLMHLHPRQYWTRTRTEAECEAMGEFFKGLAEELQTTVIVFSGADLGLTNGRMKLPPQLIDLRGFGLPVRYCSTVFLTHRESFFRRETGKFEIEAGVFVKKSSSGRTGKLRMGWNGKNAQFTERHAETTAGVQEEFRSG